MLPVLYSLISVLIIWISSYVLYRFSRSVVGLFSQPTEEKVRTEPLTYVTVFDDGLNLRSNITQSYEFVPWEEAKKQLYDRTEKRYSQTNSDSKEHTDGI